MAVDFSDQYPNLGTDPSCNDRCPPRTANDAQADRLRRHRVAVANRRASRFYAGHYDGERDLSCRWVSASSSACRSGAQIGGSRHEYSMASGFVMASATNLIPFFSETVLGMDRGAAGM